MEKFYYTTVTTSSDPKCGDEWIQYEGYDKDEAIKVRDYRNLHECDKEFHTETRVHKLLDDRLYEELSGDEQCVVLGNWDTLPEEDEEDEETPLESAAPQELNQEKRNDREDAKIQDLSYKKKTVYLGYSDGAEIHMTYALRDREQTEAKFIHFGGDSEYRAYVINEGDPVPEHYKEIADLSNAWWICFYDDCCMRVKIHGGARIYRAGQYGCLIALAENAEIEEEE